MIGILQGVMAGGAFAVVGVIIGPIIAALFVTLWDIYGMAFKEVLPGVEASDSNIKARNSKAETHSGEVHSEKESAD